MALERKNGNSQHNANGRRAISVERAQYFHFFHIVIYKHGEMNVNQINSIFFRIVTIWKLRSIWRMGISLKRKKPLSGQKPFSDCHYYYYRFARKRIWLCATSLYDRFTLNLISLLPFPFSAFGNGSVPSFGIYHFIVHCAWISIRFNVKKWMTFNWAECNFVSNVRHSPTYWIFQVDKQIPVRLSLLLP